MAGGMMSGVASMAESLQLGASASLGIAGVGLGMDVAIVALITAFVVLADIAPLRLPRGDRLSGDGAIVIAAFLTTGLVGATTVSIAGGITFWLSQPRALVFASDLFRDMIRRLLLIGVVAGVSAVSGLGGIALASSGALSMLGLVVAMTYVLLDLGYEGLLAASRHGLNAPRSAIGVIRSAGGAYLGQASIAVVVAVLLPSIGVWSILILGSLILTMRQSFSSYLEIKRAYQETILALARGAEIGGVSEAGRTERLADRCVAAGRKLGLHERQLETLSYAALLHDVGLLGEAEAGCASGMSGDGSEDVSLASRSARVLEDIDSLGETAEIIRRCEDRHDSTPHVGQWQTLAAQILAVAVEWDRVDDASGGCGDSVEGVSRITAEAGSRFDPLVVAKLLEVAERTV